MIVCMCVCIHCTVPVSVIIATIWQCVQLSVVGKEFTVFTCTCSYYWQLQFSSLVFIVDHCYFISVNFSHYNIITLPSHGIVSGHILIVNKMGCSQGLCWLLCGWSTSVYIHLFPDTCQIGVNYHLVSWLCCCCCEVQANLD